MLVTVDGIVKLVNPAYINAPTPILVTLAGIVTFAKAKQSRNA
jgi:hypothetical protein